MASRRLAKSKRATNTSLILPPPRDRRLGGALLILFIPILPSIPAMLGGFIWDDDAYVEHNPNLRSLAGLWNIWAHTSATPQYYPLVHTIFWIEYRFWGASLGAAIGYKIVNVRLHASSAILLWRLLRLLE